MNHTIRLIICLIFLNTPHYLIAQSYNGIDSIVERYPKNFKTPELLAFAIQNDFSQKKDQVRALYYWIAQNISYDTNYLLENNSRNFSEYVFERKNTSKNSAIALNTLKTQTATCEGYAYLFDLVCFSLDIESEIIGGYALNNRASIGTNPKLKNHSWNAYLINDKWHLIDITWSAGYENTITGKWVKEVDDSYYNILPNRLIKTHFPAFEKWQLLKKTVSKKDFFSNPILYDYYFKTSTRLSPNQAGLITIDEKERTININFEEISKDPIQYQTRNVKISRLVKFKKNKNGGYTAKIKLIKGHPSFIKFIEKNHTIVEFKIESRFNYQYQK